MKIEAILWANAGMVDANSLLHLEGGGWRFVELESFPHSLAGSVCGVMLVEDGDFGSIHTISFAVSDDSGHVEGAAGSMTIDASEASEEMSTPRIAFAFPFHVVVRDPTLLKASVTSNGGVLGGLSLIVRRKTPSEASG